MLLNTATKDQLVDDLLDRSDDGVGRSYNILGGNNNQTREWLSQGEAKSVEDFVTGRLIADVLITQFEDDWDYVCISEVSSTANLLAETVWGLDQATLLKPTPRWLQRIIQ